MMGKTMDNQFEEFKIWLAEERETNNFHDGAEVELAYQINKEQQLVTPGIHIQTTSMDVPLFMSIAELRSAANSAEALVQKMLNESS